ncbi:hypothetical protein N0M98_12905 [Paenibacillus doosanensis]|uniref:DUF340 domain-containing protein n=1 Tax=Paenibacillus konkukensis TaxID=2020716 RepID=A0ABY4RT47_9BACL|nr:MULTISPECIES: hypothetical protein [Paenibacillus]MCS7461045.1 hypothetical protein [Paenibacillus doosanensis]UQZ85719.1 hypothetical protein SK3146_05008 [Paenibacillus konkukensis]
MDGGLNKYAKYALVLLLSIGLILFTQEIKLLKNPGGTPISMTTIYGLIVLWLFSFIGILISGLMKKVPLKIIQDFPVLGWVSITSLVFCLISDSFIKMIQAVDFLSITTPILTFAGISVADRLIDLRKTSWKVAIVAIFVFSGMYVGSAILAQIGLHASR